MFTVETTYRCHSPIRFVLLSAPADVQWDHYLTTHDAEVLAGDLLRAVKLYRSRGQTEHDPPRNKPINKSVGSIGVAPT